MAFAPPVRRGDFCYSSVIYADLGNNNLHPRASVAELAALLRPEAPSLYSKGRQPDASILADDHPWHFWSAQLIHYGLPVTKHKNTAKVRLLNALNHFKIEVPAWVLKVESELKVEWEAANRKLKRSETISAKGRDCTMSKNKVSPAKPAPPIQNGVNVTVHPSFTNDYPLASQTPPQGKEKAKAVKTPPSKRQRSSAMSAYPAASPAKATKDRSESTAQRRIKGEAPSGGSGSGFYTERESSPTYAYSPSPHGRNLCANQQKSSPGIVLSGLYFIHCDTASSMFGRDDFELTLSKDPNRPIWWSTCRWGSWDIIMQLNPGPTFDTLAEPCSVGWRLRDVRTGQLRFGKKCVGSMTFFDDQTLYGELYDVHGVGTVAFGGRRLDGKGIVDDLKDEWDEFVKEAYGRR